MTSYKLPAYQYKRGIKVWKIPKGLIHVPGKVHFLCKRLNMPYRRAIVGYTEHTMRTATNYDGVIIDEDHFPLLLREMTKAGYAFEGKRPEPNTAALKMLTSDRLNAIPWEKGVCVWSLPYGVAYISGRVHTQCRKVGIPFLRAIVEFAKTEEGYAPRFDGVVIDDRHLSLLPSELQRRAKAFTKYDAEQLRMANDLRLHGEP